MSNTSTNILLLVALFFLWGVAGQFDDTGDLTREEPDASLSVTVEEAPPSPAMRMVCIPEPDSARPSVLPPRPAQRQLVSFNYQSEGDHRPGTTVLRCVVDND